MIYSIALHLYALLSLPKCLWREIKEKKPSLWNRLGGDFPKIDKGDKKLVWVHAVSLGETKAILPLIKKIQELPDPPLILLTTSTATGFEEGKKAAATFHAYLPYDFSYRMRPLVKRVAPDLLIVTETDFWFHLQDAARKQGAKVVVVNGKLSERSFRRFFRFPTFAQMLLHRVDYWYVQSTLYEKRLVDLKIPQKNITVTGNLKLDGIECVTDVKEWKEKLGLTEEPVLTLGSTHAPEEQIWIDACKKLWELYPDLKLFIVPRHPERFDYVARLLEKASIRYSRWSQQGSFKEHSVLLVDTIGQLRLCYQLSTVAFVGGSLTASVGGHNILEPSFYGKPVLYGPFMHQQMELHSLMQHYGAGIQIDEKGPLSAVDSLLKQPALCQKMGNQGLKLIAESRGALDKTFSGVERLLKM